MINKNSNKKSLLSANPFKGDAGLILRYLLQKPKKLWVGAEIARDINLSVSWVNRVLSTLEFHRMVQRGYKGPSSNTELINSKNIIGKWLDNYHFDLNSSYLYLSLDKKPLEVLIKAAKKENWHIALTGYAVANLIKPTVLHVPPMLYLWSGLPDQNFRQVLDKLENVYQFIPVGKKANLIILEPYQKNAVFFGSSIYKKLPVVSALQLYLDLAKLDQGKFVIEQLASYWKKNNIPDVLEIPIH